MKNAKITKARWRRYIKERCPQWDFLLVENPTSFLSSLSQKAQESASEMFSHDFWNSETSTQYLLSIEKGRERYVDCAIVYRRNRWPPTWKNSNNTLGVYSHRIRKSEAKLLLPIHQVSTKGVVIIRGVGCAFYFWGVRLLLASEKQ